jgi:hypothetical protein
MDDWPKDAKFQYGDPVHVKPSFDGGAGFSGYVVGWYRPMHGKWLGYNIEHDRDHHVHVEPEKRLCAGLGGQADDQ